MSPPSATPASTPLSRPEPDPHRPIGVAMVGVGYWGSRILRNLVAPGTGAHVAWVCDREPARWATARELHPDLACTDRLDPVLADPAVEAVFVAVPPREHLALGLEVLAAGKHLFIEKPMALSVADAERLVGAARDAGLRLMVGLTYRFNEGLEHLTELVRGGTLGRVRAVHSQRSSHKTSVRHTNVLWSLAPHDVSMLMHVLGGEPTMLSATAHGPASATGAEAATLDLEFPDAVRARVYLSWLAGPKTRRMVVVGEERSVVFDEAPERPLLTAYPTPPLGATADDPRALFELVQRIPEGPAEVLAPRNGAHEPLRSECRHFLDCVRHDRRPRTDGDLGLSVTRVLETLQRSMDDDGRPLALHEPAPLRASSHS